MNATSLLPGIFGALNAMGESSRSMGSATLSPNSAERQDARNQTAQESSLFRDLAFPTGSG